MNYCLKLPFPPSANTYYRRSQHSTYMSKKGREFNKEVINQIKLLGLHDELIAERLSIRIELCAPTHRKYDIDNRIKATLDSIQKAGLILDDEQVDHLTIKRLPVDDEKKGFCIVSILIVDK